MIFGTSPGFQCGGAFVHRAGNASGSLGDITMGLFRPPKYTAESIKA